ncbi:hypothetical protein [Streptomyces roseochromogenus]|uniref:hypothetical protein n=1 Tax=Streptomyces roseochromogenus TaxID=285450 RepID=UPI001FD788BE|nr:hypothetical protein [Streptomyces roseochromogenus]
MQQAQGELAFLGLVSSPAGGGKALGRTVEAHGDDWLHGGGLRLIRRKLETTVNKSDRVDGPDVACMPGVLLPFEDPPDPLPAARGGGAGGVESGTRGGRAVTIPLVVGVDGSKASTVNTQRTT